VYVRDDRPSNAAQANADAGVRRAQ